MKMGRGGNEKKYVASNFGVPCFLMFCRCTDILWCLPYAYLIPKESAQGREWNFALYRIYNSLESESILCYEDWISGVPRCKVHWGTQVGKTDLRALCKLLPSESTLSSDKASYPFLIVLRSRRITTEIQRPWGPDDPRSHGTQVSPATASGFQILL